MKNVAIVYMAHDGFTSLYTGVGSVARDFLFSFPDVSKILKKKFKGYAFDLYATTIKYNEKCFGFSKDVKKVTENIVARNDNIHLRELVNGSYGDESYATIDYWKAASISGATFVYTLSLQYNEIIVISVDTPFAQVANYFFKQYNCKNVKIVWLPQSTVLIHRRKTQSLTKEEEERYQWEKETVILAAKNRQVFIGCVGSFMKKHLIYDYSAKPSRMIDLNNGLDLKRLENNKVSQKTVENLLKKLNVPTDRPILFSFGRSEKYKGLDLVVANSLELIDKYRYYILIFCSPYPDKDGVDTLRKLKFLEAKRKKDIKVYLTHDFSLPHYIMQWQRTNILAILSRAEPSGLIPIESRYYNNPSLTLLVSNVGGFPDQVENNRDGFITKLDSNSIKKSLNNINMLSRQRKRKISSNGYNKVTKTYDQASINTRFINNLLNN